MASEMNKVDMVVSEMMLTYPGLYENRQQALEGIFLGTNYYWDKNGCVQRAYVIDTTFDGPVDISDLDENDRQWDRDDEFAQMIRARNELERRARLFRAENIHLFAKMKTRDYGYSTLDSQYFDYDSAVFYNAPFGKIDPEWLRALEEFISSLLVGYNGVFSLHYDDPKVSGTVPAPSMFDRMPERFQKRYNRIKEIEEKCEAQSGTKARMKAFWENHGKRLMDEIKAEDSE